MNQRLIASLLALLGLGVIVSVGVVGCPRPAVKCAATSDEDGDGVEAPYAEGRDPKGRLLLCESPPDRCTQDCNDGDPTIFPGAPEIKGDGIDSDCDGLDFDAGVVDDAGVLIPDRCHVDAGAVGEGEGEGEGAGEGEGEGEGAGQ